jgi:hypothetical protein
LTGLDFHQLDSNKKFHRLMIKSPSPRLSPGAIAWIPMLVF